MMLYLDILWKQLTRNVWYALGFQWKRFWKLYILSLGIWVFKALFRFQSVWMKCIEFYQSFYSNMCISMFLCIKCGPKGLGMGFVNFELVSSLNVVFWNLMPLGDFLGIRALKTRSASSSTWGWPVRLSRKSWIVKNDFNYHLDP